MANKAINDLLKYGAVRFSENFNLTYAPSVANSMITNAFNGWNMITTSSRANIDGSHFYITTGGTGSSNTSANINRNLEGYSLNRSFDMQFSFNIQKWANLNYSFNYLRVSMCGNPNTYSANAALYGLEFYTTSWNNNNSFSFYIYNNGTLLGTPYSGLARGVVYYVFVQKRGDVVGITINTTGVKPSTPAYTYTMTNKTMLSNSLIISQYVHGDGDQGAVQYFDNLDVILY